MKLDLISIRKLTPAGLWDLAELTAVISTLMAVVSGGFGGAACVRRCRRMVVKFRQQLAQRALDNFNMQVKAWILQCPDRTAHVRGVIGEAAIKRWHRNRFLDYTFTEKFGDWKNMFSNDLRGKTRCANKAPVQNTKRETRSYTRKPFALVKIPNAERILYGQARQHVALVADANTNDGGIQVRPRSTISPVRFRPDELVSEAQTGVLQDKVEAVVPEKRTRAEPRTFLQPNEYQKTNKPPLAQTKPP